MSQNQTFRMRSIVFAVATNDSPNLSKATPLRQALHATGAGRTAK